MRSFIKTITILLLILVVTSGVFGQTRIQYFQKGGIYEYRIKLLELVLAKTAASDGPMVAVALEEDVTQARGLTMLKEGTIDIVSLGTTLEREANYLPVKIDILRGILGYRVSLITKDMQSEFEKIRTLNDFNKFKAGFGAQWGDMAILRENKLNVDGITDAAAIIQMLSAKRIDYFPRGINEAWVELEANKDKYPNLAVESSTAFFYPFPVYFFVNKDNTKLANRIERGLKIALADGSFKELFLKYHKDILAKVNMPRRRLFILSNSTLPTGTPPVDTSWWLEQKK